MNLKTVEIFHVKNGGPIATWWDIPPQLSAEEWHVQITP